MTKPLMDRLGILGRLCSCAVRPAARAGVRLGLVLFAALAPAFPVSLPGGDCWIQDAAAADGKVWLLCDREQLATSADEGRTWRWVRLPSGVKLRAIAFLDARRGFVAGDGGTLLATEDGGSTWRTQPAGTVEHLTDIHFVGELGWISGYGGTILHSSDGGRSWERQFTGLSQPLEAVFFLDAKHGWAVGWAGTILRTVDGGQYWQRAAAPGVSGSLSAVYFRDPQNGWIVGMWGQILRTRDGGASWETQPSPVRSWLQAVVFDKAGRGWIAGGADLLLSEDGGESWKLAESDLNLFLDRFVESNESVWAVGPFGALTRPVRGDQAWRRLEIRFAG